MRRNLFDDTVDTNRDLSKTRAGKAERGGNEVRLGLIFTCAWAWACKVEAKRNVGTLFAEGVHRARAVRGFPESKVPILTFNYLFINLISAMGSASLSLDLVPLVQSQGGSISGKRPMPLDNSWFPSCGVLIALLNARLK